MTDSKLYLVFLKVRVRDRIIATDHWWQEATSLQIAKNLSKRRVKAMGYDEYVYDLLVLPEGGWGDAEVWPVVRPINNPDR